MLIGVAIAKQVHATATTRTKVLTARLMAFSLHAGPLGAETLSWEKLYIRCQATFRGERNPCIILRQNDLRGKLSVR